MCASVIVYLWEYSVAFVCILMARKTQILTHKYSDCSDNEGDFLFNQHRAIYVFTTLITLAIVGNKLTNYVTIVTSGLVHTISLSYWW